MKICTKCKEQKNLSEFTKTAKYHHSWCRDCKKRKAQEYRLKKGIVPKNKGLIINDTHKKCLKCFQDKHIEEFHKNNRGLLKRAAYCKKCTPLYFKELKSSDVDRYKEKSRKNTQAYRDNHREHWRSLHRIHQFNRKNLAKAQSDGTITEEFMKALYATEKCCWRENIIPESDRTAEHIVPLSEGGIHGVSNLKMSCLSCNSSKFNCKK
jgi:HNH endonuclease